MTPPAAAALGISALGGAALLFSHFIIRNTFGWWRIGAIGEAIGWITWLVALIVVIVMVGPRW